MSYHTVDITLGANGSISAHHTYDMPNGKPRLEDIDIPDPENEIKVSDEKLIEVLINILKENRLRGNEEYEMLGSLLYNALLNNSIGRELFQLKSNKEVDKIKIELKFNGADNKYAHWPWEYLYCPDDKHAGEKGYFLSTHPKIIMSRPVNADMEELKEPIRVLLVAPGPSSSGEESEIKKRKTIFKQPLLAYEQLFDAISLILKDNKYIHVHQLIAKDTLVPETQENAMVLTIKDFADCVNQIKPHIIHFLGHGRINDKAKEGEVAFTTSDGRVDWISETRFANEIKNAKARFVFLQACETAALAPYKAISGVARQLTGKDGLPAVIAMQCKINQDSAIDFAQSFYEKLSTTGIIGDAVQAGRQAIMNAKRQLIDSEMEEKDFAFGIPVLYVKDRTPLFTITTDPGIEVSEKNIQGNSSAEVTITCFGGCNQHNIPITAKFCPYGCGEFVERPVINCVEASCPQKLLKSHLVCPMCGVKNNFHQA